MLKYPQRNIVLSVESVLNKLYNSSEKLMISNSGYLYSTYYNIFIIGNF